MANLKEKYNNELRPALKEELGIDNIMAVPKLTKVVINMGVGEAANDKKHLDVFYHLQLLQLPYW